jgi:hypothetical protein
MTELQITFLFYLYAKELVVLFIRKWQIYLNALFVLILEYGDHMH